MPQAKAGELFQSFSMAIGQAQQATLYGNLQQDVAATQGQVQGIADVQQQQQQRLTRLEQQEEQRQQAQRQQAQQQEQEAEQQERQELDAKMADLREPSLVYPTTPVAAPASPASPASSDGSSQTDILSPGNISPATTSPAIEAEEQVPATPFGSGVGDTAERANLCNVEHQSARTVEPSVSGAVMIGPLTAHSATGALSPSLYTPTLHVETPILVVPQLAT